MFTHTECALKHFYACRVYAKKVGHGKQHFGNLEMGSKATLRMFYYSLKVFRAMVPRLLVTALSQWLAGVSTFQADWYKI